MRMRPEYPATVRAIWKKDLAELKRLLADPLRINEMDPDGRTPLMAAAIESDVAALRLLLGSGAEVNLQDPAGWSALHFAVQEPSSYEVCLALLNAGARHDLRESHGNTPLFIAVINARGSGDLIRLLRSRGAVPLAANHSGVSPCALARRIANYPVAQFFADLP